VSGRRCAAPPTPLPIDPDPPPSTGRECIDSARSLSQRGDRLRSANSPQEFQSTPIGSHFPQRREERVCAGPDLRRRLLTSCTTRRRFRSCAYPVHPTPKVRRILHSPRGSPLAAPRSHQQRSRCRRPLCDAQILAWHADPRTTEHHDRARGNLDRHGVHFLSGFVINEAAHRVTRDARPACPAVTS
jgi:hypothetical protein